MIFCNTGVGGGGGKRTSKNFDLVKIRAKSVGKFGQNV